MAMDLFFFSVKRFTADIYSELEHEKPYDNNNLSDDYGLHRSASKTHHNVCSGVYVLGWI